MSKLDTIKFWVGANWQLLAAKLILLVVWSGAFFAWGSYHTKLEQAKEEADAGKQAAQQVVERIPTIAAQERQAAEQRAQLKDLKEKFDEMVDAAGDKPECTLSADELRSLQDLAR